MHTDTILLDLYFYLHDPLRHEVTKCLPDVENKIPCVQTSWSWVGRSVNKVTFSGQLLGTKHKNNDVTMYVNPLCWRIVLYEELYISLGLVVIITTI